MARSKILGTAPESFLFEIKMVAPDYSFGSAHPPYNRGYLAEYAHTEIDAVCLIPRKFAGRATRFILLGDRAVSCELNDPREQERPWNGVGTLTMRGSRSKYLGTVPFDALLALSPVIAAGTLRFIYMSGAPLRHGSAHIDYFALKRNADPDDY